jgi:hypothetical protein
MPQHLYAIGILESDKLIKISEPSLSPSEAADFAKLFQKISKGTDYNAVVLPYPISRAILHAKPKSRSA